MQPTFYSFWYLLQEYKIQIPIIQRDYAQGRSDEKATSIRAKFLDSLYEALVKNQPLDLDFVYGTIEAGYFIPLDGQQRLTTLFLLHWYLAIAEDKMASAKPLLARFTYETRASSREFCEKLVASTTTNQVAGMTGVLSNLIRDASWFQPAWERDPTVEAILTMLDSIQDKFGRSPALFDILVNTVRPIVGFQFLELKDAGLTDELYLKMNARGKPLTNFENWKAEFDLFLQLIHPDLQHEFGQKTDGVWTDFFWQYRDKSTNLVDGAFKRYLDFVTKMLGIVRGSNDPMFRNSSFSFKQYRQVYAQRENVKFLFLTLDFLHATRNTSVLFNSLFVSRRQQTERVTLFEGRADLIQRCLFNINGEFDLKCQVLLFGLLYYIVAESETETVLNTINAKDLLRILRNLLERVRQQNDTVFNSNLRENDLSGYLNAIVKLVPVNGTVSNVYDVLAADTTLNLNGFQQRAVEHERAKARAIIQHHENKQIIQELEDLSVFRGTLTNLVLDQGPAILLRHKTAVQEIWSGSTNQSLIIRAWLTQGDYSVRTTNTMLGPKYFFGNSDHWYTILANDNNKLNILLPQFLNAYLAINHGDTAQKLQQLITVWLDNQPAKDWRYYFIKYSEITDNTKGYFAISTDFKIRLLSSNTLKASHINPYVKAVSENAPEGCFSDAQYVNGSWDSPLWFQDTRFQAFITNSGWRLSLPEGYVISPELVAKYNLQTDAEGQYTLTEAEDSDRVKVMVAFADDSRRYELIGPL
jgi:hypothetical protein